MDANETKIAIQAETTWGEEPGAVALVQQRFTSADLKHRKITDTSKEIRGDAQISEIVELGVDAGGGFNYELSYSFFALIAGALRGEQVSINLTLTGIDISASADTLTGEVGEFSTLRVDSWLRIEGATNPANNGLKKVSAVNGDGSVVTFADNAFTANETGAALTIRGRFIRNGLEKPSFLIEKQLAEEVFMKYPGCMVNTWTLDLVSRQIATGTFGFIGQEGIKGEASVDVGGYGEASTNGVMNASHNVGNIELDGSPLATALKSLSLSVTPNLRPNDGLGTKGLTSIGHGTIQPTGSINAYFNTFEMLDLFLSHEYASLSWRVSKPGEGTFIFELPHVSFNTGDIDITGLNTDLMQTLEYTAIRHPSRGFTMQVDIIPG